MSVSTAAAAALAVEYADRLLVRTARDVHRAVSRRSFGLARRMTGSASAPVRLAHDAVSTGVYGAVSGGARVAGAALAAVDSRGRARPLEAGRRGRLVSAVVNGLVGESLAESDHPLAIELSARRDGVDVGDLAATYPDATADVVVFVHGLCESDESWQLGAAETGGGYPERLGRDTCWTPVVLRYNTGLRIERNGELLSDWLQDLVTTWPVPVRRIALVGHSMGGLVALAACRAGADASWTSRVRSVVCLGTPHLGAPLEQAVHHGSRVLEAFPESAPFAAILDTRSGGILDLRSAGPDCEPLPHATYHCVSASLGGPLGLLLGDLLVRRSSARGRIAGSTTRHLVRTHHFALLNHPDVYADLRRLLTEESEPCPSP